MSIDKRRVSSEFGCQESELSVSVRAPGELTCMRVRVRVDLRTRSTTLCSPTGKPHRQLLPRYRVTFSASKPSRLQIRTQRKCGQLGQTQIRK